LFCEQCFHACRILREEQTPHVALEFIGQVFRIQGGTVRNHWLKYKARSNEVKHAGPSPALSSQELDEIIDHILHGFQ
jgi:hypothetical protein